MSSTKPPRFTFDLPAIFRQAVWLGRTIRAHRDDLATVSDYRAEWTRFRDVLNPLGLPYGWNREYAFARVEPSYRSPEYDRPYFGNAVALSEGLPPEHGPALTTLAAAAVLVNSENPRPGGFELLGSGTLHLWHALSAKHRQACRDSVAEAIRHWIWRTDAAGKPQPHAGRIYEVRKPLSLMTDWVAWRVAGRGSLKESQNAEARAFAARQRTVRELVTTLPTVAPEHTPPALRRAYELVATAAADALRFMSGVFRYRGRDGFLTEAYWRDVTPVYHTAEEALRAYAAVELELRATGTPSAFIAVTTGLKEFMTHAQFAAPRQQRKQKAAGQLLVNRATTLLEQLLQLSPFGHGAFEGMRDELARACHPHSTGVAAATTAVPVWNRVAKCLWFRGKLVRRYIKKPAPQQVKILDAFQRVGWPPSVTLDTGMGLKTDMDRDTVEATVRSLNEGVVENTIRFGEVSAVKGAKWEPVMSG